MTLGQKIRKVRLMRGLTQSELAGDCVTRNMLSQIENDQATPSMRTLEHIAETLEVSVGWLLSPGDLESDDHVAQARALLRDGQYDACMTLLQQEKSSDDERILWMRALCAQQLSEQALMQERFAEAKTLAQQALACAEKCLYPMTELRFAVQGVLARCCMSVGENADEAAAAFRETYAQLHADVRYHLLMARYHLEQEHIQAAEREIWSIAELPDADRAEYLILRGRIANRKEQYENAVLYFQQAQETGTLPKLLQRELYAGLEKCYKETEQYKLAYEYAAKQREL